MPDTITIAGKTMNKNVVYFGGAAALGFIGYAWWKNGTSGPPEMLTADPNLGAVPPPTDRTGFSVTDPSGSRPPQTNAEWRDLAVSKLVASGIEAAAISSAIGKYLGHQPLTKTEQDLVRQALAAAGDPPQGGPYSIVEIPSGGVVATKPVAVSGLRYGGILPPDPGGPWVNMRIQWDAQPGMTYKIFVENVDGAGAISTGGASGDFYQNTGTFVAYGMGRGYTYRFTVAAINSQNEVGPERSITAKA
jgi:hypothetical protein